MLIVIFLEPRGTVFWSRHTTDEDYQVLVTTISEPFNKYNDNNELFLLKAGMNIFHSFLSVAGYFKDFFLADYTLSAFTELAWQKMVQPLPLGKIQHNLMPVSNEGGLQKGHLAIKTMPNS